MDYPIAIGILGALLAVAAIEAAAYVIRKVGQKG